MDQSLNVRAETMNHFENISIYTYHLGFRKETFNDTKN